MKNSETKIAYFSAEIGISSSIPTYSGGLGILAGDHIKASADKGLRMVGISLLYREGYFKQIINDNGEQIELYPSFNFKSHFKLILDNISITLRQREVWIRV